jgi:hypothetical protein
MTMKKNQSLILEKINEWIQMECLGRQVLVRRAGRGLEGAGGQQGRYGFRW